MGIYVYSYKDVCLVLNSSCFGAPRPKVSILISPSKINMPDIIEYLIKSGHNYQVVYRIKRVKIPELRIIRKNTKTYNS